MNMSDCSCGAIKHFWVTDLLYMLTKVTDSSRRKVAVFEIKSQSLY